MSVVPVPPHTRWVPDPRGGWRGVRVSAHPEAGVVVVSVWRSDECVATARLRPGEAADLASALTASLAELAEAAETAETGPVARQRAG
ncbi:hypothetical protein ATJ97_0846 [Georgenia soli]|uniref:Uncharacterized protein n=1 Tax=Georgenia soli TaxID=638953 RepID=A0A2A9EJG3_9MICO|nr:hypothetical protein [Georgenia soli]PFG38369.1 hypothetical protein ATJ97_0846 [Georgenia soli]